MKIDDSAWPLVVATMPTTAGHDTLDVLERYFSACFARGERFVLIVDTRPLSKIPDALWRKRIVDWMNDPAFKRQNGRLNVGSATIVSSTAVRAALTALGWLWKAPSPQYYATGMSDATDWCIGQLRAAGVPITPALEAFHAPLSRRVAGMR